MTFEQDKEFEKRIADCFKWKPTYRKGFPYSLPELTELSIVDMAYAAEGIVRLWLVTGEDCPDDDDMIDRFAKTFEPTDG